MIRFPPLERVANEMAELLRECVEGRVEECTDWNRRTRAILRKYDRTPPLECQSMGPEHGCTRDDCWLKEKCQALNATAQENKAREAPSDADFRSADPSGRALPNEPAAVAPGTCVMGPPYAEPEEEWSLGVGPVEAWAFVKWLADNYPDDLRRLAVAYSQRKKVPA